MPAQIRLAHRRDRMAAHHRMAVDAVHRSVRRAGEQRAEQAEALQAGLAAEDDGEGRRQLLLQHGDSRADIAHMRGGIEGGADLVVHETGQASPHHRHQGAQARLDRLRRAGAKVRGDADSRKRPLPARRLGQAGQRGPFHAQARGDAGLGQRRQRVGRAGKVVSDEDVAAHRANRPSSRRRTARRQAPAARRLPVRDPRSRPPPPTPGAGWRRRPPGPTDGRGCPRRP